MEQEKVSDPQQTPSRDSKLPGEGRAAPEKHAASATAEPRRLIPPRSQRVNITVPILVYGNKRNGEPFQEETHSLVANAHGGLILLAAPVVLGQKLLLTNPKNMLEVQAKVAYLGRTENGKQEVGVGFLEPAPRFWHIHFPPEDWDPSKRKLPSSSTR